MAQAHSLKVTRQLQASMLLTSAAMQPSALQVLAFWPCNFSPTPCACRDQLRASSSNIFNVNIQHGSPGPPRGIAPHLKHRDGSKLPGPDVVHAVKGHDVGLEGLLPRSLHTLQDGLAPTPLIQSRLLIRPTRGIQLGALEGLGGTLTVGPPAGARGCVACSNDQAGVV